MARYVNELVLNQPDDFVQFIMNDFLQKNQYVLMDYKGEQVFRAGDAMVEGYRYLKWYYMNGVFHVEAWLTSVTGKEMDLDGFVGALQKKPYKDSLEQLYVALRQPIPAPQNMGQSGSQPGMQPGPQPVPVRTVDNTSAATMARGFGILSMVTGFLIPIVGIILSVVGLSRVRMGKGSSMAGRAKAGQICAIIGIVVSILMWLMNILLVFG